jgi:hypothetical protein
MFKLCKTAAGLNASQMVLQMATARACCIISDSQPNAAKMLPKERNFECSLPTRSGRAMVQVASRWLPTLAARVG